MLLEKTDCSKFIVSGSCLEYGKAVGSLSETSNEENHLAFAWAKNSLKNYLALRCNENRINWIWLRIFYAYGPGQRTTSLIPTLFKAIRNNQIPDIQNPNNANDFIHVADVADAFVMACMNTVESGIYNIGSGSLFRVSDIWSLVQKHTQSTKKNEPHIGKSETSLKTKNPAVGGYANSEKSKVKLDWVPKISIEKGIQDFIYQLSQQENL